MTESVPPRAPEPSAAAEREVVWKLPAAPPRTGLAGWALSLAVIALAASLFVGWMAPLALIALMLAILALRRRGESRTTAIWALVLSLLATAYSAGWLLWAWTQLSPQA